MTRHNTDVRRGSDGKYRAWVRFKQSELGIDTSVEYRGVRRPGFDYSVWCIVSVRDTREEASNDACEVVRRFESDQVHS